MKLPSTIFWSFSVQPALLNHMSSIHSIFNVESAQPKFRIWQRFMGILSRVLCWAILSRHTLKKPCNWLVQIPFQQTPLPNKFGVAQRFPIVSKDANGTDLWSDVDPFIGTGLF